MVRITLEEIPHSFQYQYLLPSWKFGTGKIVSLLGEWYLHIPMTKEYGKEYPYETVKHVVGIDRGLRFLATTYDEKGTTTFFDGKTIMQKRDAFQAVRSEAQSRGTKSAKRVLKRVSGRENRWQRCPKCGRIRKENRHHDIHEYICDCCGYRSNDDRIGAMNIQLLGTFYVSGDTNPKLKHKEN